jgi:tetratricopeptide (TPR) repeat protein
MKSMDDPFEELGAMAGRRATRAMKTLHDATDAYQDGRERDALRIVKPLAETFPDALGVQELYGMSLYANGKYAQALKILEDFTQKSGSFDQYPILMDCYRAAEKYDKVDELWAELGAESPSGEVVAEGRIVHSQSLAERGQIKDALKQLRKKVKVLSRPADYHLRLWYCLADLEERAGNVIEARQWFNRVAKANPDFADIQYRMKQLN